MWVLVWQLTLSDDCSHDSSVCVCTHTHACVCVVMYMTADIIGSPLVCMCVCVCVCTRVRLHACVYDSWHYWMIACVCMCVCTWLFSIQTRPVVWQQDALMCFSQNCSVAQNLVCHFFIQHVVDWAKQTLAIVLSYCRSVGFSFTVDFWSFCCCGRCCLTVDARFSPFSNWKNKVAFLETSNSSLTIHQSRSLQELEVRNKQCNCRIRLHSRTTYFNPSPNACAAKLYSNWTLTLILNCKRDPQVSELTKSEAEFRGYVLKMMRQTWIVFPFDGMMQLFEFHSVGKSIKSWNHMIYNIWYCQGCCQGLVVIYLPSAFLDLLSVPTKNSTTILKKESTRGCAGVNTLPQVTENEVRKIQSHSGSPSNNNKSE